MKYLIYSESDEAKALAAELRADKNNEVGIRTGDPSLFNAETPERADVVYSDSEAVADAYPDAEMRGLPKAVAAEAPEVAEDAPEVVEEPKAKKPKAKKK